MQGVGPVEIESFDVLLVGAVTQGAGEVEETIAAHQLERQGSDAFLVKLVANLYYCFTSINLLYLTIT